MKSLNEYVVEGLFDIFTKMNMFKLTETMFKELQALKGKTVDVETSDSATRYEIRNIRGSFSEYENKYPLCIRGIARDKGGDSVGFIIPIYKFDGVKNNHPSGKVDKKDAKVIIELCKDQKKVMKLIADNLYKQKRDAEFSKFCQQLNQRAAAEAEERKKQIKDDERAAESEKIWRGQAMFNSHM